MDGTLERAAMEVRSFVATPAHGRPDAELLESAVALHRIAAVATAGLSALVFEAQGRDLPRQDGAASTVSWLRDLLRVTAAEARTLIALAETLDARVALADALASGAVNVGQAVATGQVLRDVPAEDPALVDKVEGILIEHARQFEPTILRRLGERVLAHVNPELADARLRDRLDREESAHTSVAASQGRRTESVVCAYRARSITRVRRSSEPQSNRSRPRSAMAADRIDEPPRLDEPTP